ncbi:KH domain-containing protein [Ignisphaera sp. 4213-co]|uniref:KH domain-containing protein n=1 Tax=Ignisphaera cupida TaxID=3050454 RepID=A0ABD4Z7R2_9CREN|nr:KH domain-containing protein [Ignisphaera sp. 4213-co]MDK6028345.1 KH domain-containing protein [Ignisphaera sp. 4213-co]
MNLEDEKSLRKNNEVPKIGVAQGYLIPGVTRLYIKIPLERIGALIGKGGETLKKLMEQTQTKITVDEVNGTVIVEPQTPQTRVLDLMKARDIILAIGYGFSPERAFRLLEDDQILIVIDLKQYVKPSENHLTRVKGRLIGEDGKARKNLEEMTGTEISIYDDYVAVIGDYESANIAREAILMLIDGRQHSTVYKYVDKAMRQIRRSRMVSLWEKEYMPK